MTRYRSDVVTGGALSQRNLHQSQSNTSVWTIIGETLNVGQSRSTNLYQTWHCHIQITCIHPPFKSGGGEVSGSLGHTVGYLYVTPGVISTRDHGDQNRYFKTKPGSFPNPNQMVFVCKPCRSIHTGLWQERNGKVNPNKCKAGTSKHLFWNLSVFSPQTHWVGLMRHVVISIQRYWISGDNMIVCFPLSRDNTVTEDWFSLSPHASQAQRKTGITTLFWDNNCTEWWI